MFDQQIGTDGNMAKTSAALALAADTENDAVDMTVLLSFEDGETDLVVELIDLYLQDAPVRIEAIKEAVAKSDGAALKRAAHSLKGSSGTLGVRQLAAVCDVLERLANDSLTPEAAAMLHRLETEFARVQEAMLSERQRSTRTNH